MEGIAPTVLSSSLVGGSHDFSWFPVILTNTARHRPYLALFEQSLSKHVNEIAREYKSPDDKERYIDAADRFRLPYVLQFPNRFDYISSVPVLCSYWDWATEPTLPDIVAIQETVSVHLPNGSHTNIKNPLYGYFFNPVYSDFGDGLPDEKTVRGYS